MNTELPSLAWTRTAVGVDLVDGQPVIAQAVRRGGRVSVVAPSAPAAPVPARTAVAGCLLHREGFARWLTAPLRSARKARRVFPALLDVQLPFPVEECVSVLAEVRRAADDAATRGLAVGARGTELARRIAAYQAAGHDPHTLDHEGLALWTQALAEHPPASDAAPRVVVYQGSDRTTLALGRGREFVASHSARQWNADQAHRFLFANLPEGVPETQWLWCGPATAGAAEAHAAIAGRWPGPLTVAREPVTFLARALAVRALRRGPYPCNLRLGPHLHPELVRRSESAPVSAAVAVIIAGVWLLALNLGWQALVAQRSARLQTAVRAQARALSPAAALAAGSEALVAQRTLAEETTLSKPITDLAGPPTAARWAAVLDIARRNGLLCTELSLADGALSLQGSAGSAAQLERAVQELTAAGFKTVPTRKPATESGRVPFTIRPGGAKP
jgi:hypothetical protein